MNGTPCSFRNREGYLLHGLCFDPPPTVRQTGLGIVYLPGFVLGYSAVHRLGLDVLSALAEAGHPGFVFDHSGIGESEGPSLTGSHDALTRHVVGGGLVDDTLEALRYFRSCRPVERLLLVGHCGGALTASYAGAADSTVAALALLSPPVLPVGEPSVPMPEEAANQRLRLYLAKLTSGQAWRRLLFGRSDYRILGKTLLTKVARPLRRGAAHAFNERFVSAVRAVGRRGHVLLIVGDHDEEFRELCEMVELVGGPTITHATLADTSHGFVTDESMAHLLDRVSVFAESVSRARRWTGDT